MRFASLQAWLQHGLSPDLGGNELGVGWQVDRPRQCSFGILIVSCRQVIEEVVS